MNWIKLIIRYMLLLCLACNLADAAPTNYEQKQEELVERFNKSVDIVKTLYVKKIAEEQILDNAISGMISNLDPHSEYLSGNEYKNFLFESKGEFGGLGISVTPKDGLLLIISPLYQTPADKAGIKAGDFLLAVNGKPIREMSLTEVMNQVRGQQGSTVNLTILRQGKQQPLNFNLKREIIRIKSVSSKMLHHNVGYIKISQFQQLTALAVKAAIKELQDQAHGKLQGMILDLRNNPGGLLDVAIDTAKLFLDKKNMQQFKQIIVYAEGQSPQAQFTAYTKGHDLLANIPIITLINNGSASATEIVAGALQDYKRSLIVGTQSFGKGSIQTVIELDSNHAIKLTTALYHTPAGKIIQNVGITPDIALDELTVIQKKPGFKSWSITHEAALHNHLSVANQNQLKTASTSSKDEELLAQQDYQLFTALKILQAMSYSKHV